MFDDLATDDFAGLPFDMEWLYGMSLLAETCCSLDDTESAAVLYELLAPYAAFNVVDTPEGIRGSVSRYLGLLAATLERWNAAGKHYDNASAMNASMGARPWQAHTQADHARMLLSRNAPGDREQAQALLDAARVSYRELNLNSYVASTSARAHFGHSR